MHLTLRQLTCFDAVARLRSFTRAAEELHLTQPAVSMQVKQLEGQIGLTLTENIGRAIHLTDAGKEVYAYARAILQELEELETVLVTLKGEGGGRLRLAAISTANYFAPRLLGTFRQRFPSANISMDVTNRESILAQIAANGVDMAIMGQPPGGMELEAIPFMDNPLVIVARPGHPLAGQARIPLQRLEEEVFLVREPGSGTRGAMERFFKKRKLTLNAGMEMGSLEAVKQGVQAGLGLGLIPRDAVEMELRLQRLVILDVVEFPIRRHWYVVLHKGKRLTPLAAAFRDLLIGESGDLLKAGTDYQDTP